MQSRQPLRWPLFIFTFALGCGGAIQSASRNATEGAVEAATEPDVQRKAAKTIEPDHVREITRKTGEGTVDGMLDVVTDDQRQAAMRKVTKTFAGDVVTAGFDAFSAEMGTPEERKKAIGELVHEIAKQGTLGFQSAIDEAREKRDYAGVEGSGGSVLVAAGDAAAAGKSIFFFLAIGLGVLVLALGGLLVWALRRNRFHVAKIAQHDDALFLLMQAMRASGAERRPQAASGTTGDTGPRNGATADVSRYRHYS